MNDEGPSRALLIVGQLVAETRDLAPDMVERAMGIEPTSLATPDPPDQ